MIFALLAAARALIVPAVALFAFELWFRLTGRVSDSLAPPSQWLVALREVVSDGSLLAATVETFLTMMIGLGIGAGLGLFLGIVTGLSRTADRASYLAVEMLRPIPSVALLPLALLIFGFGNKMEIFVIAFATFWPVLILVHGAIRQVEPRLLEVATMLNLNSVSKAIKIMLPAAAPRLMTAFRLATTIALVVAVTCEIGANPQGLGHALMMSQETLRPARMFAFLLWVGLIGLVLNIGLLRLERWLFAHRGDYDQTVSA